MMYDTYSSFYILLFVTYSNLYCLFWMDGWMDGWMDEKGRWMGGWMDGDHFYCLF